MAKKYRVGVIGRTGKGNYGHGLDVVWKGVEQVDVVAVADDNPGGLIAAQRKTTAKKAYADYRQMLDNEKLDIVAVGPRWLDKHHELVLAAAEHGCHIYMEKPFCQNLEQADEMVQACEMRHLKLAIAHNNRYCPTAAFIQKVIEQGEIGDLLELRARGKEDARRGGGEDLWVLGTHMLDLMRKFAGDVSACYATVTEKKQPVNRSHVYQGNEGIGPLAGDEIEAMYTFENKLTGFFSSHRGAAGSPSRFGLQIFGSKGVVEMTSGYQKTAYILQHSSWSPGRTGAKWLPVSPEGIGKPSKGPTGSHPANHAAVIDLIDAIENDRNPISSMYDARAATEMIVGIYESHRLHGPAKFPLKNRKNPLTMLDG